MKWLNFLLVLVFGIAAVLYLIYVLNAKNSGDEAPLFSETLINGDAFHLADQKGRYTLLSFWGSWCGPCLKENPKLVALYKKYGDQSFKTAQGFDIVSIAIEKSDKRTKALIDKHNLYWPHHIIKVSSLVLKEPLALKYGVSQIPTKILVDPKGKIVGRFSIDEVDAYLQDK